jgi:hypothetical protein
MFPIDMRSLLIGALATAALAEAAPKHAGWIVAGIAVLFIVVWAVRFVMGSLVSARVLDELERLGYKRDR